MPAATIPRRRRLVFAAITILGVGAFLVAGIWAADVFLHWRMRALSGINVWGFRGPTLSRKQPNETRIAMLGGSTVFGFGLRPDEAIPALLEGRLNEQGRATGRRFSVANLGAPGQGAYCFTFDLSDYAFLDYDIAVLYEGYNDLGIKDVAKRAVPNYFLWHRESPIFRLTGYYPILPLVLREKGTAMLSGGDVNRAEKNGQVVFRPGLATQVAAGALNAAAAVSENLEKQIGRLSENAPMPTVDDQCIPRWKQVLRCGPRCRVLGARARQARVVRDAAVRVGLPHRAAGQCRRHAAGEIQRRRRVFDWSIWAARSICTIGRLRSMGCISTPRAIGRSPISCSGPYWRRAGESSHLKMQSCHLSGQ